MNRVIYIFILSAFISCNKIEHTPTVNFHVTLSNNIIFDDIEVLSKSSNWVKFKVSTIYLNANYVFSEYAQGLNFFDTLQVQNQNVGEHYYFDSSSVNKNYSLENYSAAIILDKNISSGWGEQGYSDGFNYFMTNAINNGNECLLVGAARETTSKPCKFYTPTFINEMNAESKDALYSFCSEPLEGSASIYDAINLTMDKMISEAKNENKHIVVFWDKADDEGGMNSDDLISKAIANNIKISFLNWDHSNSYVYETVEISEKTGGFYGVSYSTSRIQTVIFSLHKILSKNYVNLNFYMRLNSVYIGSSSSWNGYFKIDYEYDVPFHIEL